MHQYDYLIKTLLVGPSAVGKSTLAQHLAGAQLPEGYQETIGVEFAAALLSFPSPSPYSSTKKDLTVKLQIWDTAGKEDFRGITRSYYRGTPIVFIVINANSLFKEKERNIKFHLEEINKYGDVPRRKVILLETKIDTLTTESENHVLSADELKTVGFDVNSYAQVSFKTAANLNDIRNILITNLTAFLNDTNRYSAANASTAPVVLKAAPVGGGIVRAPAVQTAETSFSFSSLWARLFNSNEPAAVEPVQIKPALPTKLRPNYQTTLNSIQQLTNDEAKALIPQIKDYLIHGNLERYNTRYDVGVNAKKYKYGDLIIEMPEHIYDMLGKIDQFKPQIDDAKKLLSTLYLDIQFAASSSTIFRKPSTTEFYDQYLPGFFERTVEQALQKHSVIQCQK